MLDSSLYCSTRGGFCAGCTGLVCSFSQGWEKHHKNRTRVLDNYAEELQNISGEPGHEQQPNLLTLSTFILHSNNATDGICCILPNRFSKEWLKRWPVHRSNGLLRLAYLGWSRPWLIWPCALRSVMSQGRVSRFRHQPIIMVKCHRTSLLILWK